MRGGGYLCLEAGNSYKPTLDSRQLNNYYHALNISCLNKVIERVVAGDLQVFLNEDCLD